MSGTVRAPRFRVSLNGAVLPGCKTIEIDANNNFSADTFTATFSTATPGAVPLPPWGATDTILVGIEIANDAAGGYVAAFAGEVDEIEADPIGQTVTVHGRDLSRRLRDAKTNETFPNRTSSEIAATLAARHGLTPVVTPTVTLVSRYYANDHDHLSGDNFTRTTNEWDLLVYFAQHEGYDLFVVGTSLYFQPAAAPGIGGKRVVFKTTSAGVVCNDVMQPRFSRSLTLAKDIDVIVRSWNVNTKRGFDAKSTGAKSGKDAGGQQRIVIVRPNLTRDAAIKLANNIRADLTKRERLFRFAIPGDSGFTPRTPVNVFGTGSSWDGYYFTASVHHAIDMQRGYLMTVECKNHSPLNESIPG